MLSIATSIPERTLLRANCELWQPDYRVAPHGTSRNLAVTPFPGPLPCTSRSAILSGSRCAPGCWLHDVPAVCRVQSGPGGRGCGRRTRGAVAHSPLVPQALSDRAVGRDSVSPRGRTPPSPPRRSMVAAGAPHARTAAAAAGHARGHGLGRGAVAEHEAGPSRFRFHRASHAPRIGDRRFAEHDGANRRRPHPLRESHFTGRGTRQERERGRRVLGDLPRRHPANDRARTLERPRQSAQGTEQAQADACGRGHGSGTARRGGCPGSFAAIVPAPASHVLHGPAAFRVGECAASPGYADAGSVGADSQGEGRQRRG